MVRSWGDFDFARVHLVNHFEAIAQPLPHLGSGVPGGGRRASRCARTGTGVAGLVPYGDDEIALASEGGHSTLPSASPREHLVIEHLRQQFGHVSTE